MHDAHAFSDLKSWMSAANIATRAWDLLVNKDVHDLRL
jgi:hypothetical protein